jgi:hypothetical protein
MISLDDKSWTELFHAYGEASDIPAVLHDLDRLPLKQEAESEPYFSLWSALCHQGDVYTGSYAAVPHIVRIMELAPERVPWTLFQMVACIEIARVAGRGPEMPSDLAESYFAALTRIPAIVAAAARTDWEHWCCDAALAAIAAAKGSCRLANAIFELDPDTIERLLQHKFGE